MTTIRCSSLPLLMKCRESARIEPGQISSTFSSSAAMLGTGVHYLLREWIEGRFATLADVASKFSLEEEMDEFEMLFRFAWQSWERMRQHFPNPMTEQEMSARIGKNITLTGHLDVYSIVDDQIRIADFKTGWVDKDFLPQLKGYAMLAMRETGLTSAYVCTILVRDRVVDGWTFTSDEIDQWWEELELHLKKQNEYSVGAHCSFCPRALDCHAKDKALVMAKKVMLEKSRAWNMPTDPAARASIFTRLLEQCSMVERAAEQIRDAIRADVMASGGSLTNFDGDEVVVEEVQRQCISYLESKDIISSAGLPLNDLNSVFKVSKSKLTKAVMANEPRGRKGRAADLLMDQLREAGAVSVERFPRMTVKHGKLLPKPKAGE